MVTSGEHLLSLVNDVLDLAKAEASKLEVRLCQTSVADTFLSVITMLAARAQDKGLVLRSELPNPALRVMAAPLRLRQVLLNLVTNGIMFAPEGEVVLRSETSAEPAGCIADLGSPPSAVVLSVCDTGVGIKRGDVSRIFGQFELIDSPLTRSQEGTALGLALSKHLTELMGGRIWIESEFGKGTTFYVALPG
jgi:signal transduction histidine kinase